MIPLKLRISGFLSYRDPVELDFEGFDLACISGQNGAGKSSLLDAITWALFGEARGREKDALINLGSNAAEVALTFQYEGNTYRVQRSVPRGRTTVLEFQVLDDDQWRPLTEKSSRETQNRINQTLRLDYDTFINASFFLQGKADEFTQKKAGERKAVLGNILGLEVWETYKVRALEHRREIERAVDEIDGRIAEIDAELGEEDARQTRLKETELNLTNLTAVRTAQETALEALRRSAAVLEQQRTSADVLSTTIERSRAALAGLQARLATRMTERDRHAGLIDRAAQIESAYNDWQRSRQELEKWDKVALEFREYESQRQPFLREIDSEKARLEQEKQSLGDQYGVVAQQSSIAAGLQEGLKAAQTALEGATFRVAARKEIEAQLQAGRERQAELKAGNETLRAAMLPMDERIKKLETTTEGKCPLCGQELTPEHRNQTIERLKIEGSQMGDRFRANKNSLEELAASLVGLEESLQQYSDAESDQLSRSNEVAQLTERIGMLKRQSAEWETTGAKRLGEIEGLLKEGKYSRDARKQLAKLDRELAKLGYDASAHDAVRKAEASGRTAQEEYSDLKSARGVMEQIQGEISSLEAESGNRVSEIDAQEKQYQEIFEVLKAAESQAPDLDQAESELLRLREQENQARDEVTRARQLVDVLVSLRQRRQGYSAEREEHQKLIAQFKTLERAFGKDGVPALLIEQALPQIESKANDLLDRLSDGRMSIKFTTMAEYKDKKRGDLRETLDIQISDSAGLRDYEMYSGGEAFRVNFAIRLALSEVLAQRKGARLQTLVIDEGFGSQDAQGRQRLIEAINTVRGDFAKILVITHLDELKDAFPTRIEVEKNERGSSVKII